MIFQTLFDCSSRYIYVLSFESSYPKTPYVLQGSEVTSNLYNLNIILSFFFSASQVPDIIEIPLGIIFLVGCLFVLLYAWGAIQIGLFWLSRLGAKDKPINCEKHLDADVELRPIAEAKFEASGRDTFFTQSQYDSLEWVKKQ